MKRVLTTLFLAVSLFVPAAGWVAVPAYAAVNPFSNECANQGASATDICQEAAKGGGTAASNPVLNAFKITITIMAFVTGFTSIIVLILAGINFATSGGDSAKVGRA